MNRLSRASGLGVELLDRLRERRAGAGQWERNAAAEWREACPATVDGTQAPGRFILDQFVASSDARPRPP
jgi:hypothetical protein